MINRTDPPSDKELTVSIRSTSGWRKSSRSGGGDNCVEIAHTTNSIAVRDSKDPTGPILAFTRTAWTAFTAALRTGQLHP